MCIIWCVCVCLCVLLISVRLMYEYGFAYGVCNVRMYMRVVCVGCVCKGVYLCQSTRWLDCSDLFVYHKPTYCKYSVNSKSIDPYDDHLVHFILSSVYV